MMAYAVNTGGVSTGETAATTRFVMVQLSFLVEASFTALTAIVVGSALGLTVARNVIADSADQPSYQGALHFAAPRTHLAVVFVLVYAGALLTTLAPAARAAHVHPAEALRYE